MAKKVVLTGAGRVATHLGEALKRAGYTLLQVYSRTEQSAAALASSLGCAATSSPEAIATDGDIYFFCVSDDVLAGVLSKVALRLPEKALWLHTAGSVPVHIFEGIARRYGVIYPLQTFSKEQTVDFRTIPLFIEAKDDACQQEVAQLAATLSESVTVLSSEKRARLHVAAVFACNFVNHCYAEAAELLREADVDFKALLPLIDETAKKVHRLSPIAAQTGPAARNDHQVMDKQRQLLDDDRKALYDVISRRICKLQKKQDE